MPQTTVGGRTSLDFSSLPPKAQKVFDLLSQGLSTKTIANAVGIAESEVSRFKKDEDFMAAVSEVRVAEIETLRARDRRYDKLEDTLLDRFEQVAMMICKPNELFRALDIINKANRRSEKFVDTGGSETVINNTVVLNMPAVSVAAFAMNQKNEMVSINSRSLTALPTELLMKELTPLTIDFTKEMDAVEAKTNAELKAEIDAMPEAQAYLVNSRIQREADWDRAHAEKERFARLTVEDI